MKRLRRLHRKRLRKKTSTFNKLHGRAIATGAAAAITFAALQANKAFSANMPDDHQQTVSGDTDSDLISDAEEMAIGYKIYDPNQNRNELPDGVELARRCAAVINQLPDISIDPNAIFKIRHELDGLEQCDICGQWIHMGGSQIINPVLKMKYPDSNDPLNSLFLPDLAVHYMEHGSFDCLGSVHNGRADLPRLLRVLQLRFPYEPNDHQLSLDYVVDTVGQLASDTNDLDGDLMADSEELKAGYDLYDADQDQDLMPDGIELAKQCAEQIDALPVEGIDPILPGQVYKQFFFQRGLEQCEICGQTVNMGFWRIVNPNLAKSMDIYDITLHYLSHGSFSYSGQHITEPFDPFHCARTDIAALTEILEMPQKCGDLGTKYLPGDTNKDCAEDFKDFADFANRWLDTTDPQNE